MNKKEYIDWLNEQIDWRVRDIELDKNMGGFQCKEVQNIHAIEIAMLRNCLNHIKGR